MVDPNRLQAKLKALKHPVEENPLANQVFNYLQVLSACFLSFSHGSNDTANAVGPLVGLWLAYNDRDALKDVSGDPISEYIILFGAAGMIIGLWVLGHKVIETIGSNLVTVTPPSGFAMELGTAFTVLVASKLSIPVSTTHCAVGAVVSVGWMKSHEGGVSWKTFRNIALAWIVTLPVAGAVSALVAFLLNHFIVANA
jgi:sodium-dependent phosphate transporter